ncbi:hypothetical protein O181_028057 [Austropuccinia psidii MF-1]|uniref:Integrase catalytic domain-containing protein n=1 Tax=Austropuccinia psidii MF-1 TaxID=1389203 RepID=A0A9Q3CTU2_9BASI|nr:hypothetical protein [Austropuccinia psidii MF-1]
MDWVTGLPPGNVRLYNALLVFVHRFGNNPRFLPCHKDDIAMNIALLIWNRVVSWTGIFTNLINDQYSEITQALWRNLPQLFGTKASFSSSYSPQAYGLAERMIQNLEDIVRRFCEYGVKLKDCVGFTH